MDGIVLIADPSVTRIPVRDCGEPLVDLEASGVLSVDPRRSDPTGAWRRARAGVAERLADAATRLPAGTRFLLVEGYRPPALQEQYFAQYLARLGAEHHELSTSELHRLASRFVAPPDVAPHSAGAALDLTLCREDGTELPMGTPVNATPEESDGACYTGACNIDSASRANRAALAAALEGAGFVNYPTEWWHWSYGDRYWALRTDRTCAIYGPATYAPPVS